MIGPIELTEFEVDSGGLLGWKRWYEAVRRGCKDNFKKDEDGVMAHVFGAFGEMAYAKGTGVYFVPTINTFKAPDVGRI